LGEGGFNFPGYQFWVGRLDFFGGSSRPVVFPDWWWFWWRWTGLLLAFEGGWLPPGYLVREEFFGFPFFLHYFRNPDQWVVTA